MKMLSQPHDSPRSHFITRWARIVLGSVFVVIGFIGIFVPLLPTTPFLLLAAAFYSKSSKKFYNWLINHKWFGPYIKNYRETKKFSNKQKAALIITIVLTVLSSALLLIYL